MFFVKSVNSICSSKTANFVVSSIFRQNKIPWVLTDILCYTYMCSQARGTMIHQNIFIQTNRIGLLKEQQQTQQRYACRAGSPNAPWQAKQQNYILHCLWATQFIIREGKLCIMQSLSTIFFLVPSFLHVVVVNNNVVHRLDCVFISIDLRPC